MSSQEIQRAREVLDDLSRTPSPYRRLELAKEFQRIVDQLPDRAANGHGPESAAEQQPLAPAK